MDDYCITHPKDGYETGHKFRVDYSVRDIEAKFQREDYLKKISIPLFDVTKYLE